MKKAFLTIIAAVAMTLSANAQISIIPKAGISIAKTTLVMAVNLSLLIQK